MLRSIIRKGQENFKSDSFFFWCLMVLMIMNPVASFSISYDWRGLLVAMALVYCTVCSLSLILPSKYKVVFVLKALIVIIVGLYDLITLFCTVVFHQQMSLGIYETLLATNINEIKEFVCVFFPWWLIVLTIAAFVGITLTHYYCLYRLSHKMSRRQMTIHIGLFLYISIVMIICHKAVSTKISESGSWDIPFETIAINLRTYESKKIDVVETNPSHPAKIVVIIGESHSKGHSSLYGYGKDTNPILKKLVDDSLAFVFTNVESPAAYTTQAFKYILNTRRLVDCDKDWYRFPSVITIMKAAGYHTYWYSNQDEVGLFDNIASSYAHICDSYTFNCKQDRLDGSLIGLHSPSKTNEFIIYHLMGQHVEFSKRYPHSFEHFKVEDYDAKKYSNRRIVAEYDNACLYNDYVVSSIMNNYKHDDAIVIYFPDHGLDVYQSSISYFGHAIGRASGKVDYGREIPFVIYTSPIFKQKHNAVIKLLINNLDKKLSTADITFIITKMTGYKLR